MNVLPAVLALALTFIQLKSAEKLFENKPITFNIFLVHIFVYGRVGSFKI